MKKALATVPLLVLLASCGSETEELTPPTEASEAPSPAITPSPIVATATPSPEPSTKPNSLYGQWIPNEEDCPAADELTGLVMNISRNAVEQYEYYCSAEQGIPSEGSYSGVLLCSVEGDTEKSVVNLSIRDDGKLLFENNGSVATWKQCPWPLLTP